MANDPKLYKWGPKGMLVAKAADSEVFIEKAALGLFGGPNSSVVKKLMGFKWGAKGMMAGTKYARNADVIALLDPAKAAPVPPPTPAPAPQPAPPRIVTSIKVRSTSDADQENVPITFGQVFAPGDVPSGAGLVGIGVGGRQLPLQMDVKATHPDGSVRHAAIAGVFDWLTVGAKIELGLGVTASAVQSPPTYPLDSIIPSIRLLMGGKTYEAATQLNSLTPTTWLRGAVITEWRCAVPIRDTDGTVHPHLAARLGIRTHQGGRARVEVVIENAWAYEPNPQNFTYDALITVDGQDVYAVKELVHLHHARWRKVFWVGGEPMVHIEHDAAYLTGSRAVSNYDLSVKVRETTLAGYLKKWNDTTVGPMKIGPLVTPAMSTTGGRDDIGLLPGWAAAYLISQDERAKRVTLGTADMAGSWPIHYRDKDTDLPISVIDYPYMTLLGNPGDTLNRDRVDSVTGKKGVREAFPVLSKTANPSPYRPDSSHQPAFAFLAYLVTAEHYYLEEQQFWCMYNVFSSNPGYRGNIKGLLHSNQVRGQAWSLRTLAETAYVTPDAHPLKSHFLRFLDNNIAWYSENYLEGGPLHNKLGVITNGAAATGYKDGSDEVSIRTAAAPWQDDFNTAAWGRAVELGFVKADPVLRWKAKFPIGRMVGDGVCWLAGAEYSYVVRAAEDGPIYETFAEAYRDTVGEAVAALPCGDRVAAALGHQPNDMGGYSSSTTGFPSNMQPALAYAAMVSPEGKRAWDLFMSRSIKPDYGISPQFAIIPRST